MKFDIVSTIYYMKLHITNNKELFTRDDDELHAECFRAGAAFGILLMQDALEAQKQFMRE